MQLKLKKETAILVLGILGLVAAGFSGLEAHVPWIASLCSGFSSGCQETAQYTLFSVPVWGWGLAFYAFLLLFAFRLPELLPWWVGMGLGVEASLVWTMFSIQTLCVFCLANLLIVVLLVPFAFEKQALWRFTTVSLLSLLVFNFLLARENKSLLAAPSTETAHIAAEVMGRKITMQELEFPLAIKLLDIEKQAYRQKKERLDNLVTEIILQKEADRRGINIQDLVKGEVLSKGVNVSDEEIDQYYMENRGNWADWKGSEEELKQQIKYHLMNQKAYGAAATYALSLAGKDGVKIFLKEPQLPFTKVDIDKSYSSGPTDAPVTVVIFSDYECPVCRKTHGLIKQVKDLYGPKVRWVYKDFPLKQHRWAAKAAEAARCAGEQGKFWEYQDIVYTTDKELNPDQLKAIAGGLHLKEDLFAGCLDAGKMSERIEKDKEDGKKAGVSTTPTLIINGRYFPGAPTLDKFKELIDAELAQKPAA